MKPELRAIYASMAASLGDVLQQCIYAGSAYADAMGLDRLEVREVRIQLMLGFLSTTLQAAGVPYHESSAIISGFAKTIHSALTDAEDDYLDYNLLSNYTPENYKEELDKMNEQEELN